MNLELAEDRERALAVPCPPSPYGCAALAGEVCTRDDGKGGREPIDRFPAHVARLAEAGVVHAPLDSRYLRDPDRRF